MTRIQLQVLANRKLVDAEALLAAHRWSAAYYHSGYVVECGLKACVLRYLGESDIVFRDLQFVRKLSDCWTHDLVELVKWAGLSEAFGKDRGANSNLEANWNIAIYWKETSRYEEKSESEARELHKAIVNDPDGVFSWIQSHW